MSTELRAPKPPRKSPSPATVAALAAVGVLAVIVGVMWATGGFGTDAKPFLGSRVEPGELVETRFWDVAVHDAEVSETEGVIRVSFTALNKQKSSSADLLYGMIAVRLPDGTPMVGGVCDSERGFQFGPLITSDGTCIFSYGADNIPEASIPGPGPFDIEVVVRDQVMNDNLLTAPEPLPGEPAAWLPLMVSVEVEEP